MQKCCIQGCNSHKYSGTKKIDFFKFPIHDEILLKKWLALLNLPNWKPTSYHHICSMHLRDEDLDSHQNKKQPLPIPSSVPVVLPAQPAEIAIPNCTRNTMELKNNQFQLPAQIVNLALPTSPMILIPSHFPGQLSAQFPTQIIAHSFNQPPVNNSTPISAEYLKQIDAQNIMRIAAQEPNQIFVQNPAQYPERIASQSAAEISKRYTKQLPNSTNPGQDSGQLISESIVLLPIPQPGLRKILPKPQSFNPDTLPTAKISQKCKSNNRTNSIPKPDILIIPRFEKSSPNASGKLIFSRYPDNKRPILRISINKEYDSKKAQCPSDKETRNSSMETASSSPREMTIENSSTNRAVTFKLDPRTGEIVVTTRQLDNSTRDAGDSKSTHTERKVDDTHSSPTKLRRLYIKGQQECIALRRRLRVLRQRHRQEQEEIRKLQEHLTELGDKVQKTDSEKSPTSRCAKRKERENSVQPDDCEALIREVKKIKHDMRITRRDLSTTANGRSEEKLSQSNEASRFSKPEYHSSDIADSSEGETGKDSEIVATEMGESSVDLNGDAENEDTVDKTDYLDAEFLMG